jgi:hypothetical protein
MYNQGKNHPKFKDLSKKKFGELIALEYVQHTTKKGRTYYVWKCLCSCGEYSFSRTSDLRSGSKTKCKKCADHISSQKRILPDDKSIFNRIFRTYKRNAKNRNLTFELNQNDFEKLLKLPCFYCNEDPMSYKGDNNISYGEFKRNGIDRIDSKKGYSIDNVITCCKFCNQSKNDMTKEEFVNWIIKTFNNLKKNNII